MHLTKNKINVAELLKDCPKGMELDCTIYDGVVFHDIVDRYYPIRVRRKQGGLINLNAYGCLNDKIDSKCVIFPKGKTTWEGFVPPCQFKDGDIVVTTLGNVAIIRKPVGKELSYVYGLMVDNYFYVYETAKVFVKRFATEEEKEKLFQAIKDNGYKWNEETKTLEKFPKFNACDRIRQICGKYVVCETCDNDLEIVHNKFDISTLKPFDKVLVRDGAGLWRPGLFGKDMIVGYRYFTAEGSYKECIPYEGNEHLLATNKDCDEHFKTWD